VIQPCELRESLRESLSRPNIRIVPLDEWLEGLMVPSSYAGVLAMGRPVLWIGAADSAVGSQLRASDCGVTSTYLGGDTAARTQALRELSGDFTTLGTRWRPVAR
jgi:colanic acid biosynthesis glycosyl transferase WcaI